MSVKTDNDKIYRQLFYYIYSGEQQCFTCGVRGELGKNLYLGHYIKRKHCATAWHPSNTRPQCKECNEFKDGRADVFRMRLIWEIGLFLVEDLEKLAKTSKGSQFNREISNKMNEIRNEMRFLDKSIVKDKLIEING